MPVKSDDIAARGEPIKFYSLESAKDWRAEYGGWIFAADNGVAVWFPLGATPSPIMRHDSTRGLSGMLI
jgi:hypothetical protein